MPTTPVPTTPISPTPILQHHQHQHQQHHCQQHHLQRQHHRQTATETKQHNYPLTVQAHTATACPPISPTSGTRASAGAPPRSAGTPTWQNHTAEQNKNVPTCHSQQGKKNTQLRNSLSIPPLFGQAPRQQKITLSTLVCDALNDIC